MKQIRVTLIDGNAFDVHAGSWEEMIRSINMFGHNYTINDIESANAIIADPRHQCQTVKQTLEN